MPVYKYPKNSTTALNYLIAFIVLDFINIWGLDSFVLPKSWALSLLIVWYESFKDNDWFEGLLMLLFSAIILVCSLDWMTSLLGCELMGFGGLVQIFIYWEIFKASRDANDAPGDAITLFMVPMLTYAVLQRLGVDYNHPTWQIPYHRAISTQGNPVFLSMTIGMLVPLALLREKNWSFWPLLGIMAGGLWAAGSKSGWLAAGIGSLCYLI